jgi:hypothetical protein
MESLIIGSGDGSGDGYGYGYGYGDGDGSGDGSGSGYGYGDGDGYGSGYGSGFPEQEIGGARTVVVGYAAREGIVRASFGDLLQLAVSR